MKYRWDDFVLDLDAFRLERDGRPLALEPKAFNLLALMIARPGHVFTKQEIFERLWPGTVVTDHALTRVVAQLRRVLGDEARDGRYIETVPTRGYRWLPHVETLAGVPITTATAAPPPAPLPPARTRVWSRSRALAAVSVIAVVAAVAWTQRDASSARLDRESNSTRDVYWPVQVTTHSGLDLHPAFSPQGDAIAFASDRSGTFELYVRALSGPATDIALTSDGQHNVQPAWSPDGSSIAYHSYGRGGIWVMPARGGVPRQLAAEGSHPAWSGDGTRIAFQSDEPSDVTPSAFGSQSGATIQIIDADGLNRRGLTTQGRPLGGHAAPAWTADGRFIAFSVFDGGPNNGVWLAAIDSGEVTQLTKGLHNQYELAFTPANDALYVAGGDPFILRIPFDPGTGTVTGEQELLAVPGVAGVRGLTMSPDGKRLGFGGLTTSSQLWAQPVGPDGNGRGEPRALTTDTSRRNSLPKVSPDGTRVAYVSRRGGEPPNVWVVGVDGNTGLQVTENGAPDKLPYWFPDGKRIAFLSTRDNGAAIWSVDLDTRREELMMRLSDVPAWRKGSSVGVLAESSMSRSMTSLAMAVIVPPSANRQIFLSPTSAYEAQPISDASRWMGYPSWSADEKRLAVELKDGSSTHAAVLDVESGVMRQLTRERGQTWVRSWSPDSRKIAAAVFRDGRWDLRWIDASSGAMGQITPASAPNTYVRYPEWSPRGDLVVYERGELRGNVWTLRLGK